METGYCLRQPMLCQHDEMYQDQINLLCSQKILIWMESGWLWAISLLTFPQMIQILCWHVKMLTVQWQNLLSFLSSLMVSAACIPSNCTVPILEGQFQFFIQNLLLSSFNFFTLSHIYWELLNLSLDFIIFSYFVRMSHFLIKSPAFSESLTHFLLQTG